MAFENEVVLREGEANTRGVFFIHSGMLCLGLTVDHAASGMLTERIRLTRFFALPDSNTSPRVKTSVLGHVTVSQMGIVQVPYAAVTVKYVRALIYHTA